MSAAPRSRGLPLSAMGDSAPPPPSRRCRVEPVTRARCCTTSRGRLRNPRACPQGLLRGGGGLVHSGAMKRVTDGRGSVSTRGSEQPLETPPQETQQPRETLPRETQQQRETREPSSRRERQERRRTFASVQAERNGGVVHRRTLRADRISRDEERSEVRGGRWTVVGRHTIFIGPPTAGGLAAPDGSWPWRRPTTWPATAAWAVWESGSGALLDGSSALLMAGLSNFDDSVIHVTVPRGSRSKRLPGVRLHRPRMAHRSAGPGLPRVSVEAAT